MGTAGNSICGYREQIFFCPRIAPNRPWTPKTLKTWALTSLFRTRHLGSKPWLIWFQEEAISQSTEYVLDAAIPPPMARQKSLLFYAACCSVLLVVPCGLLFCVLNPLFSLRQSNRFQYIQRVADYYLTQKGAAQTAAFLRGLRRVISVDALSA